MKKLFIIATILLLSAACAKQGATVYYNSEKDCENQTGKVCARMVDGPKEGLYSASSVNLDDYNKIMNSATTTPTQATSTTMLLPIKYNNTQYGFIFSLPADWQAYSVYTKQWTGNPLAGSDYAKAINGPEIYIRNPNWTAQNPYEDIPIMVFTPAEWNEVQKETLAVSAAPIGPTELGSNQNYVFALPPRFDYDYRTGYQEVEKIMQSSPLQGY